MPISLLSGLPKGFWQRLLRRDVQHQHSTTVTDQAWLYRRLWSLPLKLDSLLGKEEKPSKVCRQVSSCRKLEMGRYIVFEAEHSILVFDTLPMARYSSFNPQERAGVKMVMIQDGPQNTGADKPLRISGEPFKVQVGFVFLLSLSFFH